MSLGTFIRGILRKGTGSNEDPGNTKPLKTSSEEHGLTSSPALPNWLVALDEIQAKRKLEPYKPLIDTLNEKGIDYCVVGGMGVALQVLDKTSGKIRETMDIDIMVDELVDNDAFVEMYLDSYADSQEERTRLKENLFPDEPTTYEDQDSDLCNISIKGAKEDLDGKTLPRVDLVRQLNQMTLADLEVDYVAIDGQGYRVASVETLKKMKLATIQYLKTGFDNTSRPQDFIDLKKLEMIEMEEEKQREQKDRSPLKKEKETPETKGQYGVARNEGILRENQASRPR